MAVCVLESKIPARDVQVLLRKLNWKPAQGTYLLKPNLLKPLPADTGVTTNPAVAEGVIQYLHSFGIKKIIIGDNAGGGDTNETFAACGYQKLAKKYGVKLVDFDEDTPVLVRPGQNLKTVSIAKTVLDTDYIINIAKLKTHSLAKISLCMKNLLGCITPKKAICRYMHKGIFDIYSLSNKRLRTLYTFFNKRLVDLNQSIRPALNIIDGIVGHEGEGPSHGSPIEVGVLIGGYDIVAVDWVAAKIMGCNNDELLDLAEQAGLGRKKTRLLGVPIEKVQKKFKLPANWIKLESEKASSRT